MVRKGAMLGVNADGVAAMTAEAKSAEEKEAIEDELEAERRQQLQDQWNMGKLFLAIGGSIILWGWMNGFVSWHFHYLASLFGFRRFPLPEDIKNYLVGGGGGGQEL